MLKTDKKWKKVVVNKKTKRTFSLNVIRFKDSDISSEKVNSEDEHSKN